MFIESILGSFTDGIGRCYSAEAFQALLRFCSSKGIHLVSNEMHALSMYKTEDRPSAQFTLIRAIDFYGLIDPNQVHIFYGMSKVSTPSPTWLHGY